MGQSLDLNNLVPDTAQVTIGDQVLNVKPPTLRILFVITKLANKLSDVNGKPEDMDAVQAELKSELDKLIPGLENHEINSAQLLALTGLVNDMSIPESEREAKTADGGTVKPDPKAPTA